MHSVLTCLTWLVSCLKTHVSSLQWNTFNSDIRIQLNHIQNLKLFYSSKQSFGNKTVPTVFVFYFASYGIHFFRTNPIALHLSRAIIKYRQIWETWFIRENWLRKLRLRKGSDTLLVRDHNSNANDVWMLTGTSHWAVNEAVPAFRRLGFCVVSSLRIWYMIPVGHIIRHFCFAVDIQFKGRSHQCSLEP